jgi:FAD synthase
MELPQGFTGEVVHGFGRGHKTVGFATANLSIESWSVEIGEEGFGVYAGIVTFPEEPPRIGVISIGKSQTFSVETPTFEVHILDFDNDIYGQIMNVDVRVRIRSMMSFSSVPELKRQIVVDCHTARAAIDPLLLETQT